MFLLIFFFFSKNIHLLNFSTKERPWPLSRQLSNVESSTPDTFDNYNPYYRSMSIDNSTVGDLLLRSNRAMSVEPNLIAGGTDMKMNNGHCRHYLVQQNSLPNRSTSPYDSSTTINRQFTSSETIDQSR